jgi:hypothetical protein
VEIAGRRGAMDGSVHGKLTPGLGYERRWP